MQHADTAILSAPWTLQGDAVVAIKLVRKEVAQRLIPEDAKIICVWPHYTLAILYLEQYRDSPVGEYREVIVAPALVRRTRRVGFWIARILVDDPRSLEAGRTIWALSKQAARMQWASAPQTTQSRFVTEAPQMQLSAALEMPQRSMRLPFIGAAMSRYGDAQRWFAVRGSAQTVMTRVAVNTADEELCALGFSGSMRAYGVSDMKITIGRPTDL